MFKTASDNAQRRAHGGANESTITPRGACAGNSPPDPWDNHPRTFELVRAFYHLAAGAAPASMLEAWRRDAEAIVAEAVAADAADPAVLADKARREARSHRIAELIEENKRLRAQLVEGRGRMPAHVWLDLSFRRDRVAGELTRLQQEATVDRSRNHSPFERRSRRIRRLIDRRRAVLALRP
jgi:hypothetical protein